MCHENRLASLERKCRQLTAAVVALAGYIVCLVAIGAAALSERDVEVRELKCQAVKVVNSDGKLVGSLNSASGDGALLLLDKHGRKYASILPEALDLGTAESAGEKAKMAISLANPSDRGPEVVIWDGTGKRSRMLHAGP